MTREAMRAPVVAEGELVEIGLQVLVADRARMRAEQPALQERDRPAAALQGALLTPLHLGLHDHVVRPLAEALAVGNHRCSPGGMSKSAPE